MAIELKLTLCSKRRLKIKEMIQVLFKHVRLFLIIVDLLVSKIQVGRAIARKGFSPKQPHVLHFHDKIILTTATTDQLFWSKFRKITSSYFSPFGNNFCISSLSLVLMKFR